MFEKQNKRVYINSLDVHDLTGSLEDAIEMLVDFRDNQYQRVTVDVNLDDEGDGPYGSLEFYGFREETDEELTKRIEAHAQQKLNEHIKEQKKIVDEKKLFLELKGKYES